MDCGACDRLIDECSMLARRRDSLVRCIQQSVVSQRYLESVVDAADDFREIREIIARYHTLISTRQVCELFSY